MNNYQPATISASPQAPKNKTARNLLIGCGGLTGAIMLCLCAFVAFGLYLQYQEQQLYAQARAAYEKADCAQALVHYNQLIDDATDKEKELIVKAQAERTECQALVDAQGKEQRNENGAALIAYHDFLTTYPASLLAGSARQQAEAAFRKGGAEPLARETGFCDRLNDLLGNNLIPDRQTSLEQLYPACAQFYEDQTQFDQAVQSYEAFLAEFPDHARTEEMRSRLAKAIVLSARAQGAGEIPAPQVSGSAGAGRTAVVIQNDSPDKLRIIFSGPEARIEELAPCDTCQKYIQTGPDTCPELGPVGTYELPPGTYDVVVESGSGEDVTPWTGTWDLADGDEYSSCFFIITTSP